MNLNNLKDKAFAIATAKGFHNKEYSNEHWLMLVITELSEAIEADRKGERADISNITELTTEDLLIDWKVERFKAEYEVYVKGSVDEELADAVIRLLDLAGLKNIKINAFTDEDIEEAVDCCTDETFTESIFAISTIPIRHEYEYNDNLDKQVNDMILAIIGLAKHLDIDLLLHIEQKMKYNETREPLHGKKY